MHMHSPLPPPPLCKCIYDRSQSASSAAALFIYLLYLRYTDDIFTLWINGKEPLKKFHQDFNNFHSPSKLTLEYSTQINFLNPTAKLCNGHITTMLHQKPTIYYSYLHATIFQPKHITKSITYSQALCYSCICSVASSHEAHLRNLEQDFLHLSYNPRTVAIQKNQSQTWTSLQPATIPTLQCGQQNPPVIKYSLTLENL